MLLWNFQEAGRADGKEIPSITLERMISRNSDAARKTCLVFPGCSCLCKVLRWGYEPLPEEVKGWAQPTRRIRFMKFNQIPCPKDVAQSFSNDFLQRVPQHPNNHQQPSTNATKTYQEIYQEQDQHLEDLVKTWSKFGRFGLLVRCPFLERRRTGLAEECQAKAKAKTILARSNGVCVKARAKNIYLFTTYSTSKPYGLCSRSWAGLCRSAPTAQPAPGFAMPGLMSRRLPWRFAGLKQRSHTLCLFI